MKTSKQKQVFIKYEKAIYLLRVRAFLKGFDLSINSESGFFEVWEDQGPTRYILVGSVETIIECRRLIKSLCNINQLIREVVTCT